MFGKMNKARAVRETRDLKSKKIQAKIYLPRSKRRNTFVINDTTPVINKNMANQRKTKKKSTNNNNNTETMCTRSNRAGFCLSIWLLFLLYFLQLSRFNPLVRLCIFRCVFLFCFAYIFNKNIKLFDLCWLRIFPRIWFLFLYIRAFLWLICCYY